VEGALGARLDVLLFRVGKFAFEEDAAVRLDRVPEGRTASANEIQ
jgi:hypothetical protein